MPTPQQLKVRKNLEQQLARKGIVMDLINTPAPRAQWWKPAGENAWAMMPNLLPADAYHTQLYMAKGWTLIPPDAGTIVSWKPDALPAEQEVPAPSGKHKHTYSSKRLGAPCVLDGCAKTREEPFKGRSK